MKNSAVLEDTQCICYLFNLHEANYFLTLRLVSATRFAARKSVCNTRTSAPVPWKAWQHLNPPIIGIGWFVLHHTSNVAHGPWNQTVRNAQGRLVGFMTDQGQNSTWLLAVPPPHENKVLSIFIGWTFVGQPSWLLMASLDLSLYTHYLSTSFATTRVNNEAHIQNMT